MKKYIFMAAAVLFAMSSCTNEVEEKSEVKKTQVTLTATLSNGEDYGTRATYTDNEGLKATWDATETITVLSLNSAGQIIESDNLTSTGTAGRTSAAFTGTITENANTVRYICYYPAIGGSYNTITRDDNSSLLNWSLNSLRQEADKDLTRLAQNAVYNGEATFNGGDMTVTLQNQLTVFKLQLTLPDDAKYTHCSEVQITSTKDTFYPRGWFYAYDISSLSNQGNSYGTTTSVNFINSKYLSTDMTVTAYILTNKPKATVADEQWTITAVGTGKSKTITWKTAKTFEKGKMYTINATLE